MRRRIGAQEIVGQTAGRGSPQRQLVVGALEDGQAVQMRLETTLEQRIAIVEQVLGGNRCGDAVAMAGGKGGAFAGRDMFKHQPKVRNACQERRQHFIEKALFAVKDIHVVPRQFAMREQRHPSVGHGREDGIERFDIGHAMLGICSGMRRVELGRREDAVAKTGQQIEGVGAVGQIAGHHRLEIDPCGNRRKDALPIVARHGGGRDRRSQVWHHDGPAELTGGVRHDRFEHRAIPKVDMQVDGAAKGDRVHRSVSGCDGGVQNIHALEEVHDLHGFAGIM